MSTDCNFGEFLKSSLQNQFGFGLKNQPLLVETEKEDATIRRRRKMAKEFEEAEEGG